MIIPYPTSKHILQTMLCTGLLLYMIIICSENGIARLCLETLVVIAFVVACLFKICFSVEKLSGNPDRVPYWLLGGTIG